MVSNPFLGVFFHWLGGLASGSFYVPYRGVRKWSWEVYWLVGGFFSWIIAPWVLASLNTSELLSVLHEAPGDSIAWAYFWGAMWGLGGLTFGLTMRYLGLSLGMGVALGYCAAFGTLMPPIFHGEFMTKVLGTPSGQVILFGVFVCLLGIAIAGLAGWSKEKEMTDEQKKATIKEFNFRKGILVATFSGVMSASFAYGLDAASPIAEISARHGTTMLWTGLPKLCVVLLGGFTSNFIWCVILNFRNHTGYQYFSPTVRAGSAPERTGTGRIPLTPAEESVPMLNNYLFSLLRESSGTCSSSSTRWVRRRWGATSSRAGRFTWRASSYSVRSGGLRSRSGRGRAFPRRRSSRSVWPRLCFLRLSSAMGIIWEFLPDHSAVSPPMFFRI